MFTTIKVHTTDKITKGVSISHGLSLVDRFSSSYSSLGPKDNNTIIGVLVSRTRSGGASTNLGEVTRDVKLKPLDRGVSHLTIAQTTSLAPFSLEQTRVFVTKDFKERGVNHGPAALMRDVLKVQLGSSTVEDVKRADNISRVRGSARKTGSDGDRVITSRRGRNALEVTLLKDVRRQKLVSRSRRRDGKSTGDISRGTSSRSIKMLGSLLVAGHVTKDFLVKVVLQTIASLRSSHLQPVDMRHLLFNVINLNVMFNKGR